MSYLEELLPEFRNGARIRHKSWKNSRYIYYDNEKNGIFDQDGKCDVLCSWFIMDCEWEFYQDPIDWYYIIDHKCLCWFGVIGREKQKIGTLRKIAEFRGSYTYYIDEDTGFSACRPVRRDEITFYENKKDE